MDDMYSGDRMKYLLMLYDLEVELTLGNDDALNEELIRRMKKLVEDHEQKYNIGRYRDNGY